MSVFTPYLSAIYRYPIKSTAHQQVAKACVGEEGIEGDRRFMIARPDGVFLTARTHPQLQLLHAQLNKDGVILRYPDQKPLVLAYADFEKVSFATYVWVDSFEALTVSCKADRWCEAILGEPVRLLWMDKRSPRYRQAIGKRVNFSDGYPLMLIGQGSLDDLNRRTERQHFMTQFRPNLVIEGIEAFAEDQWRRLRIGEVELAVSKPCTRCAMISVDPATGTFIEGREPLRTLAGYRRGLTGQVEFGQNLIVLTGGELEAGAPVEVLA